MATHHRWLPEVLLVNHWHRSCIQWSRKGILLGSAHVVPRVARLLHRVGLSAHHVALAAGTGLIESGLVGELGELLLAGRRAAQLVHERILALPAPVDARRADHTRRRRGLANVRVRHLSVLLRAAV